MSAKLTPGAFLAAQLPPEILRLAEEVYGPRDGWTWAHITYLRRLLEQYVPPGAERPADDRPDVEGGAA